MWAGGDCRGLFAILSPLKCFRVATLNHMIIVNAVKFCIPNSQGSVVSWFPSSNKVRNSLKYRTKCNWIGATVRQLQVNFLFPISLT